MRVLVADDEPVSLRVLESSLKRWDYEVVVARDGLEAARLLEAPDAPKLAILDWMMPGLDGAELCRRLRLRQQEPYTYVLLLSARRSRDDVVAGLDAGADDYLTKPFDPEELKVRLRTGKRILYLQDQLIAAREALRDLAMHDPLTGVWNRSAILDILSSEMNRATRHSGSVALILADLDHFKSINDTHGHLAGDEVLRLVTKTMSSSVRPYDSVGRFGGEEFIIVLPGCDARNAVSHAERLRLAVERIEAPFRGGAARVTMSMGVAIFDGKVPADAEILTNAADAALYRAKEAGRNRVELADDGDPAAVDVCADVATIDRPDPHSPEHPAPRRD